MAKEIALKAGKLIMDYYKKQNFSVKDKGGFKNYVTDADTAAEKLIMGELTKAFPDYGFIGEETFDGKKVDKEFVWIVDPLDGTRNFVEGTDQFGVMIGLAHKGKPVLGVVYMPFYDYLYYAEKGKGAFCNGKKINVSNRSFEESEFTCQTYIINDEEIQGLYDKVTNKEIYVAGSAGFKICLISQGEFDIFLTKKKFLKEWDLCGPMAILEEAGGKGTDVKGKIVTYNRGESDFPESMVFSNGLVHKEVLERINSQS
ncbi:inositol monophosphatase family protein [Bacteroidota bacterium]